MKNNYKLLILGEQYNVTSDESFQHLEKAASIVDQSLREIVSKASAIDEKRMAVLVALQMASKILKLESQIEQSSNYTRELIDRIEREYLTLTHR